jgi:hypothetical protein
MNFVLFASSLQFIKVCDNVLILPLGKRIALSSTSCLPRSSNEGQDLSITNASSYTPWRNPSRLLKGVVRRKIAGPPCSTLNIKGNLVWAGYRNVNIPFPSLAAIFHRHAQWRFIRNLSDFAADVTGCETKDERNFYFPVGCTTFGEQTDMVRKPK